MYLIWFIIVKMQTFAACLVETACIFLIFLITTESILMDCEAQENEAGYTNIWIHTKLKHTCVETYIFILGNTFFKAGWKFLSIPAMRSYVRAPGKKSAIPCVFEAFQHLQKV